MCCTLQKALDSSGKVCNIRDNLGTTTKLRRLQLATLHKIQNVSQTRGILAEIQIFDQI
jgi:hypothetical protein